MKTKRQIIDEVLQSGEFSVEELIEIFQEALAAKTGKPKLVPLRTLKTVSEHGDDADVAETIDQLVCDTGRVIVEKGERITVERPALRGQVKICDETGGGSIGFVLADQLVMKVPKC